MDLRQYIAFRYPNWCDYARHHCKVQHLEGWADDLMAEIIDDLMRKPEAKITAMLSRTTKKIVNGEPTTELDKFVLAMIKMNARSQYASFRKNTIGQKIIRTHGNTVEVATFTEITPQNDSVDECTYSKKHTNELDRMHTRNIKRLEQAGYPPEILDLYREHFIESTPSQSLRKRRAIALITEFLISKTETINLNT